MRRHRAAAIGALQEHLNKLGLEDSVIAVLEVGSTAEGLSTSTSDVDLVAIVSDALPRKLRWQFVCFEIGGLAYEVLLVPQQDLSGIVMASGSGLTVRTSIRELELQYRILFGRRIHSTAAFTSLMEKFEPATFARHAVGRYQEGAVDFVEDLHGCLESNRLWSGVEFAREVARSAIDSYLVSRGDGYPKPKWRIDRVSRTCPAAAVRRFLCVEFGAGRADEVAAPQLLARAMALAMLANRAALFDSNEVVELLRQTRAARLALRVRPDAALIRARTGWVLMTLQSNFLLDDCAAICLSLFAGESLFEGAPVPTALRFQSIVGASAGSVAQAIDYFTSVDVLWGAEKVAY